MTNNPFSSMPAEGEPLQAMLSAERHRAKNTLQVVASLLSLQAREIQDAATRSLFVAAQDRVRLIAIMYDRLTRSGTGGRLDFGDALREIVMVTVRSQLDVAVQPHVFTEPLLVDLDTAVPLGLVTYELLSDALTHAFAGRPVGRVEVTLKAPSSSPEGLLTISDDGVTRTPLAATGPERLGGKIVDVLIRQLKARLTLESVSGTKLVVRFPVPM